MDKKIYQKERLNSLYLPNKNATQEDYTEFPGKIRHSMFVELNKDFDANEVLSNKYVKKYLQKAIDQRKKDYLKFSENSERIVEDSQNNVKYKILSIRHTTDIHLA